MSRCFRILGLSENATKEQVMAAYERREARYKGPDYAEEPEYVHKKLMELRAAYTEAYELAKNGPASSGYSSPSKPVERETDERIGQSASKQKRGFSSKLRDAERKEADHERGEKFHQWMERREESKARKKNKNSKNEWKKGGMQTIKEKLKKPDFSRMKDALKEIAAQLEPEDGVSTTQDSVEQVYFDEVDFDVSESLDTSVSADSGQRLGSDRTVNSGKEEGIGGEAIVKLIAAGIAIVVALAGSCGEDDISYDDYEVTYDSIYNYEEIADSDIKVRELADGSRILLLGHEEASASFPEETEADYMPQASEFARNYFGMESVEDVTDYLYGQYYEYAIDSSASLSEQLDNIFIFYGFMQTWDAGFYRNPYTGERMHGNADYLDYLNQYYVEEGSGS